MALPRNPHASLHAQLRRALANLFRVWARHTLPSCPLHGPSVSVSARSMHGSAVHLPVCYLLGPAAHACMPVARHQVLRASHARPLDARPGHLREAPAVIVPSSSVYAPAVHWPRAVYGLAVPSSRLVACTAPPGTCQPVPCAGPLHTSLLSVTRPLRERLRSLRERLRCTFADLFGVRPLRALPSCPLHGTRFSARPVHGPATHFPAPSEHGPAVSVPSSSVYGPAVHFASGLCSA